MPPVKTKLPKIDTQRSQRRGKREKPLNYYISTGNSPLDDAAVKYFAVDSLVDGDIVLTADGKAELASPKMEEIFLKGCKNSVVGTPQSKERMVEVEKKVWEQLDDPSVHSEFKQKLKASPEGKKRGGRTFSETVEEVEDTGQSKSQRIVSPVKT